MKYLKKLWDSLIFWIKILFKIFPDLLFKVCGNLFPFYIGAFILLIFAPDSISKIFDPQSFILYSSTFVFSAIYLWHKNKSRGLLMLLFFILISVIISILYAFSYTNLMPPTFDYKTYSFAIFSISILFYICFECYDFQNKEKTTFNDSSENSYGDLRDKFRQNK